MTGAAVADNRFQALSPKSLGDALAVQFLPLKTSFLLLQIGGCKAIFTVDQLCGRKVSKQLKYCQESKK